jgi:hypothetical protein
MQSPKQVSVATGEDSLSALYDTLEHKYNSPPVDFDELYMVSKKLKTLSDKGEGSNNPKLAEIYKRCADVFRSHCSDLCGSSTAPMLHCKDSLAIVDCYVRSIRTYKGNRDTTTEGYTDAIYQLADIYDQLHKSSIALPLRQEYLEVVKAREGNISDMTADACMFAGFTCELLNETTLANSYYQQELSIREKLNKGDLQIVRQRISDFQKKYILH